MALLLCCSLGGISVKDHDGPPCSLANSRPHTLHKTCCNFSTVIVCHEGSFLPIPTEMAELQTKSQPLVQLEDVDFVQCADAWLTTAIIVDYAKQDVHAATSCLRGKTLLSLRRS